MVSSKATVLHRVLPNPLRESKPAVLGSLSKVEREIIGPSDVLLAFEARKRSKSGQLLFEPVVGVWLSVERIDFNVSGLPIERDRLVQCSICLQVNYTRSVLPGMFLR